MRGGSRLTGPVFSGNVDVCGENTESVIGANGIVESGSLGSVTALELVYEGAEELGYSLDCGNDHDLIDFSVGTSYFLMSLRSMGVIDDQKFREFSHIVEEVGWRRLSPDRGQEVINEILEISEGPSHKGRIIHNFHHDFVVHDMSEIDVRSAVRMEESIYRARKLFASLYDASLDLYYSFARAVGESGVEGLVLSTDGVYSLTRSDRDSLCLGMDNGSLTITDGNGVIATVDPVGDNDDHVVGAIRSVLCWASGVRC